MLVSACSKKIAPNQSPEPYLLTAQSFSGNKQLSVDELYPFLKHKPNKTFLGFRTSLYIYRLASKNFKPDSIQTQIDQLESNFESDLKTYKSDTLRLKKIIKKKDKKIKKLILKKNEGNWVMRNLGKPPVYFDTAIAQNTLRQIRIYYLSKGFFDSDFSIKTDTIRKHIRATYMIVENQRAVLGQIRFTAEDGALKRIYNEFIEEGLLQSGDFYDLTILSKERDRIERLMKDNGYFNFTKKYINFQIDSTKNIFNINIVLSNPSEEELHKTYKISQIKFDVDNPEGVSIDTAEQTMINYKKIVFNFYHRLYKPKVLHNKMKIDVGQKYSYTQTQLTQRYLSQLDAYKFVNISFEKDTNQTIIAHIKANSLDKYQVSDEIGFSMSQGLPGPFGSLTFLLRNMFNGCETFDMNFRLGIEGVSSASDQNNFYRSTEIGAGIGLTFPQLFTLVNFNPYLINNNPKTRFSVNYNYIFRPEYMRSNFKTGITYFITKRFQQFSFSVVDINYIRTPYLSDLFRDYLETQFSKGNNLIRSFQNTVNTDVNFVYTYNDNELGNNRKANFLRFYFESGGTTLNFLSAQSKEKLKESLGINSLFIYWKMNADFRKYFPVGRKSVFASRFSIGLANPYGADEVLPYEKYLFSGGANSIRAWLPRRLGPGSYANYNSDGSVNYSFEQPGLFQIELNEELRFKIYKFLNGALFIDAGNTWLFNDADQRKNFKSNFLEEMAVAGGFGFRFDFSFFVVRLDAGLKLWDPAKELSQRWVAKNINFASPADIYNKSTWNIAVGYPF